MGDDPHPIPPGTKGTVEGIDDIATVFCRFDNGRSLGLAYGEDHYRALTQAELLEEKCARNYDKYYEAVHRDIFADVDLDRFAEEIENANDNYTTEISGQLHDKFVEIYDTDSVDSLVGFIQVPAIVESLQTGDYYPALVTLDLDSSGEHWGTCIMTPTGVIDHGVTEETEAEKAFMQNLKGICPGTPVSRRSKALLWMRKRGFRFRSVFCIRRELTGSTSLGAEWRPRK